MRYYKIVITDPDTGDTVREFSSLYPDGTTNLGALNIELDMAVSSAAMPMDHGQLKIWGISIEDISNANNFAPHLADDKTLTPGKKIQVFGGMSNGLPFAQSWQKGLLFSGAINQCFGNWQDINQTLDFVIIPTDVPGNRPVNIAFDWPAGQPMSVMLQNTLAVAYPGFQIEVNVNPNLVRNAAEPGFYDNLQQFSQYCKENSLSLLGSTNGYKGVDIVVQNNKITASDSFNPSVDVKGIELIDLIGQPTWANINTITFKTVMRADLTWGSLISLPTQPKTGMSVQGYSGVRDSSIFQGVYQITSVRHIGNFRQPDGNSWVTVYEALIPG